MVHVFAAYVLNRNCAAGIVDLFCLIGADTFSCLIVSNIYFHVHISNQQVKLCRAACLKTECVSRAQTKQNTQANVSKPYQTL